MKNVNLQDVQEVTEFKSVAPGGYVCRITLVEDVVSKEYLKLEYDIAEGEFSNYYQRLYTNRGFWAGRFVKSYKESALPFFKAFITAVETSNPGFKFDNDETKLKGKLVGLVLAEEEYNKRDGDVGVRLYVDRVRSTAAIRSGDYAVPAKKLLKVVEPAKLNAIGEIDLPF